MAVVLTKSLTDELVAEKIVDALDRKVSVDVDDIDVKVENGSVTIIGTVPSWTRKRAEGILAEKSIYHYVLILRIP